jgi:diguanylate cyclase (GGDEF)-like protein/PAS domain S-box-containing protein
MHSVDQMERREPGSSVRIPAAGIRAALAAWAIVWVYVLVTGGLPTGWAGFGLVICSAALAGATLRVWAALRRLEEKLTDQTMRAEEADAKVEQVRRELESALEEVESTNKTLSIASQRFQELFEKIPVSCVTCDEDLTLFEINQASCQLWGVESHELYLKCLYEVVHDEVDRETVRGHVAKAFAGQGAEEFEWRTTTKDGEERILSSRALRIGNRGGVVIASIDITEQRLFERMLNEKIDEIAEINKQLNNKKEQLENANKALEELAATDSLTGLVNRRILEHNLQIQWRLATERGSDFSILLIDVDRFKQFNDTFGHQEGDQVLRRVGSLLQASVRPGDIVGRFGGEEFMIVLPSASVGDAAPIAERVRSTVAAADWPKRQVTVSIGVAAYGDGHTTLAAMVEAADEALYKSKQNGRDRVTLGVPTVDAAA